MDSLLTSAGTYKVNASINGISLDDCSFFSLSDKIIPFFEEQVSNDPDITSLVISIKDLKGEFSDWMVVYSLENETEEYESQVNVENLDDELPFFKLPEDLPKGVYTIVFEVKSGKDTLQRIEKEIYYLSNTGFSYHNIDVHLPGISDNPYLVSKGQVVMLVPKLEFDAGLDPYIVWYNGKNKISEGAFSEGADRLFWKAPEMSNFYPIRAEVFPEKDFKYLAGYLKEVSILVSSKTIDINLISEDVPELVNWYVFEGNLQDSKTPVSGHPAGAAEYRSVKPADSIDAHWLPSNGTYGLATGFENIFALPKTSLSQDNDSWQMLFRFKALNYGSILTVNFGIQNIAMNLSIYEDFIELALAADGRKVSQIYGLKVDTESFTTMGIRFFTETHAPGARNLIGACVNIFGEIIEQGETALEPVYLDLGNDTVNDFQVLLGQLVKEEIFIEPVTDNISIFNDLIDEDNAENSNAAVFEETSELFTDKSEQTEVLNLQAPDNSFLNTVVSNSAVYNALWDEFALYNKPSMDVIAKDIIQVSADSESAYE